ncbi:MAG TPA: hypothetical protein PLU79_06290 [Burkholderiaceae bacterium]|nr:hypothetical protein [Burkholderiaceae bacterium]HNB43860.1 hypothetical protein [Burkholderiaceae bacterium]
MSESAPTLLDAMESRLQRWAEWMELGETCGYSRTNVLHESWSPPAPGRAPTPRVVRGTDARDTHRAICTLSMRLQETLHAVYVRRLRGEFAAQQLECSAETVPQRVREAKRRIAAALAQDEAPRADRSCVHG